MYNFFYMKGKISQSDNVYVLFYGLGIQISNYVLGKDICSLMIHIFYFFSDKTVNRFLCVVIV